MKLAALCTNELILYRNPMIRLLKDVSTLNMKEVFMLAIRGGLIFLPMYLYHLRK